MKLKKILIISLLFSFSVNIFSQSSSTFTPKINNIPSSPEAALLGRFGDIPIGYYTGTANISIPIYTIQENGVEIPISLNYHGSGIKVADEATWVGLGWSLEPEGTIIQEIRGKEDQSDNWKNKLNADGTQYLTFMSHLGPKTTGAHYLVFQTGDCLKAPTDSGQSCGPGDDASSILYSLQQGHGQPDIYNYNFAGYSGKFYINPETNQITFIDKKEDIFFSTNGLTFSAVTLDGNKFYFEVFEVNHGNTITELSGKTFKLTRIDFANGKTISFNYIDEAISNKIRRSFVVLNGLSEVSTPNESTDYTSGTKKTLTKITSQDVIINFNLEGREDLLTSGKRLKSIDIVSVFSNKKIKTFEFGYTYFLSSGITSSDVKRLKLNALKEIGYDASQNPIANKPPHQFDYEDIALPEKSSLSTDIWGYYNGKPNNTLIPDLTYFDYPHDWRYMSNNLPTFSYQYQGANRYTDNTKVAACILKKITYPTGGYTQFEYEPNSFTNQFIPDNSNLNSTVNQTNGINKIFLLEDKNATPATDPFTVNFRLSKTVTINFDNQIFDGTGNPSVPAVPPYAQSEVIKSYIEFKKIKNGATVDSFTKKWDLRDVSNVDYGTNHGKSWREDIRVEYDADPSVQYSISVYFPGNSDTATMIGDTYYFARTTCRATYSDETGVDTSISNQCGLRVKAIKNYTSSGTLASNKLIKYSEGKLLNKFEPIESIEAMYSTAVSPIQIHTGFMKRLTISSDDFGTNGGNQIGYGKVEEIELAKDNINNIGKRTHYYINVENATRKGYPNSPFLRNGLVSLEQFSDSFGTKLIEKKYNYVLLTPFSSFFGIKINNHSFGNTDWPQGVGYVPLPNSTTRFNYKFTYGIYPIVSEFIKLQSIETTEYFSGKELKSSTSYAYNTQGKTTTQIQTTTNTNNSNEQLSTTYYYASDRPQLLPIEDTMINANMTGIPLVTENRKNTELISKQSIQYSKDATTNNLILPKYIFSGKGTNGTTYINSEKKLTYDKYDSKGNIQQYTLENGTPVTILWGYNQTNPIAKIENSSYSQVAAALGVTTNVLDTYNESNLTILNNLRSLLPNAMVIIYDYTPLVGVKTITDSKGTTTYYEYDNSNRLVVIKDHYGNILKTFCYNYRGLVEDCQTVTTYKNTVKMGTYRKNNCSSGYVGSDVLYTVAAGAYSSLTSQADADALAQNDVAANGQIYANANGSCTPWAGAPTGLQFTSATASSINFSWTAVSGATGYKIYKNGIYTSSITGNTGNLTGLTIATTYNIQVLAYSALGDGVLSSPIAMSTILAAPTGLALTSSTDSSINLSWTTVAGAAGYKIYKDGVLSFSTLATQASLSFLTSSTTFNVQVLAYNASGDGVLSSPVPMSTLFAAPTGLAFTNGTATSLNFSWSAVAGATGYKLYKNGVYISSVSSANGSLSGLTSSTSYNVQVLAYNAKGDGALSALVTMSTTAPSMGVYKTSGTYPIQPASTLNGTIVNTSFSPIYVYAVVQSAGAPSGSGSGSVTISGTNITASGSFTQRGQIFVSTNYVLMSSGTMTVSGNYNGESGSYMTLAYSSSPGGTLTHWSNSNF